MTDPGATVTGLLAGQGYRAESVRPLGSGLDHTAFEVDGALVVRVSARAHPAERALEVDRETRLLHRIAAISPLPVPTPLYADPAGGWLAYRKLPGAPFLGLPEPAAWATTVGTALGRLLAVLRGQPPEAWAGLVENDDVPPHAWLREARETYAAVAASVPPSQRGAVEAFLGAAPPPATTRRVLSHNDLGIEHVLVDPATGEVIGVIDWSDAALVDPACDLGLILRDLGPDGLDAALAALPPDDDDELRTRATFYARCSALEDLAYGVGTGRGAYVRNSLAALARLLPPRQ
ncbi:aminoglycoside phosphotransferase family protein [Georgenia daeguensis]|uniref:Aminoglycoside phosphotransferase family protein n=1 Tax=Georgenia daeguensis TaxID=908355 RepID=A0ABP8EUK0_9MICO